MLRRQHKAEASFKERPNLLPNPGFEITGADGLPQGWIRNDDIGRSGPLRVPSNAKWQTTDAAHGGTKAVTCNLSEATFSALYTEVPLKPNTDYRLTGWAKAAFSGGRIGISDRLSRVETERLTRSADWTLIESTYNSGSSSKASIMLSHYGRGDSTFDDVKLCELIPQLDSDDEAVVAGDAKRGEEHLLETPSRRLCELSHDRGQGKPCGPRAGWHREDQRRSLPHRKPRWPNARLAESYKATPVSPMPPMRLILKPQEFEDVKEFLKTLK